eukprot:470977_1
MKSIPGPTMQSVASVIKDHRRGGIPHNQLFKPLDGYFTIYTEFIPCLLYLLYCGSLYLNLKVLFNNIGSRRQFLFIMRMANNTHSSLLHKHRTAISLLLSTWQQN